MEIDRRGEQEYNRRAVRVMIEKFDLLAHGQALKNYLFFERGDFARTLLDEVSYVPIMPYREGICETHRPFPSLLLVRN